MRHILALLLLFTLSQCHDSRDTAMNVKQDHAAIAKLIDRALQSEDPLRAFEKALPEVRSYVSVDSAWISGMTFCVRYKNAGIASWTANTTKSND